MTVDGKSKEPTYEEVLSMSPIDDLYSPKRYTQGQIEVWDAIHLLGLNYFEGNAVKYLCRHRLKGGKEDLEKAIQYIKKIIDIEYN